MCIRQVFITILDMESLLVLGAPHEVEVEVTITTIHKYYGFPEPGMGELPIDLGDEPWLVRDHLVY